jgi:hypothetical protein
MIKIQRELKSWLDFITTEAVAAGHRVEALRLDKGATELKVTGGGRSAAANAVSPVAA